MADKARIDVEVVVSNQKRIEALERSLGKAKTATLGLGSAAKIAASAFAAIGFTRLVGGVVSTIRQFEDLRATLVTIEGDANKAAQSFELIKEFTAGTTFQLGEVTEAFITFKNAGLQPTTDFMTNVGNIAAGMGRRLDDVARAVFNATTGEFEMLKQLGIKVKTEGDRLTVNFRGTAHNIANDGQAIIDFISEIGRTQFAGSIERQSKTLTGAFSNLQDALALAANEIGEGGLKDALVDITKDLIKFTNENKDLAHELGKNLGDALIFVRENFGLLSKILAALALGSVIASFGRLATGITAVTTAIKLMTVAARANPIIAGASLLAAGLVLVGDKFGFFSAKADEATTSLEGNGQAFNIHAGMVATTTAEIDKNTAATDGNTNSKVKNAAATDAMSTAEKRLREKLQEKFDAVLFYNESEIAANQRKEQQEIADMDMALAKGVINFEQYEKARSEIAEKYSRERGKIQSEQLAKEETERRRNVDLFKQGKFKQADISKATDEDMKEIAISTARDTLDVLASQNKKFFELQKAVKIAEAIQNTYLGATKAFAQGGVLGFVTGSLVIAAGLAQVAAIRSQQYPGRKFGGQVMAGGNYIVGENGPEMFSPSTTGNISPNSAMAGQTVTINFNVTATDASSFDNLLQQRRDTIVGVINQALNERGKRSITA